MIIVYGTKYYGKANVFKRYDHCGNCGNMGWLSSYDAAYFFTLYYIPLIPLGRKRIIDSCPVCNMHRELGLGKYKRLHKKEVSKAMADMELSPDDPEKVKPLIQSFIAYHEIDSFEKAAPLLGEKHRNNADIQSMIGAAYEHLGSMSEAEKYLKRAVVLNENHENKATLAQNLIFQGKPEQARPYLIYVIEEGVKDDVNLLYLLAESYRESGKHEEALKIIDAIENIDEELKDDEDHKEMKASSQASIHTHEKMPSPSIRKPQKITYSRGGSTWIPFLVPAAIVLFALWSFFSKAYEKGANREVWLVNGTGNEYRVDINGSQHVNRVDAATKITLAEGTWDMTFLETPFPVEDVSVTFETPFFSRIFSSPTVVLNPDGLALLGRAETTYSEHEVDAEDTYETFHSSRVYSFPDIDYPFRPFPRQIKLDSDKSAERRSRLYNCRTEFPDDYLGIAYSCIPRDDLPPYLSRALLIAPEDQMVLYGYYGICGGLSKMDQFMAFIKGGLGKRPILVDWHRLYQNAMEQRQPQYDIKGEYGALLEKEPDNPYLYYLLGRVTDDEDKAEALYLKSEGMGSRIGMGYSAISYNHLCMGRNREALDFLNRAMAARPDRKNFASFRTDILLALKDYEALLKMVRMERQKAEYEIELVALEMQYLALSGRKDEAKALGEGFLQREKNNMTREQAVQFKHFFDGALAVAVGDLDGYVSSLEKSAYPNPFHAAIVRQQVDDCMRMLEEQDSMDASRYLIAFCSASTAGQKAKADQLKARAIALLKEGMKEEKKIAKIFMGDAPADPEAVNNIKILPVDKAIMAASLGLSFPGKKAEFFKVADKYICHPDFSHLYLKKIMGGPGE